ncbi:LytR C-terminal domain-containing protein [Promicromonospora sukumoe]|uniref:LytR C-terminal domain-containing protein n=1 Tax=Promicromonospora sukumoe TaxID=88382 RepID=UPI0037CC2CFB
MTKSGYPYPPDEFDVAVPGGAPVGVHRAPRSGWSSAWPFLLVAVVCAAVAWGGITLLSGGGDEPADASGTPSSSASAPVSPSPSASGDASGEPSGEPSGEASEPAGEESSVAGDPAAADLTASVQVLNASGVDGAAGTAAEAVAAAGFTGTIDPETDTTGLGEGYTETTVLYGTEPDRSDTAAAVAAAVGATASIASADVTASQYAVIVIVK